MGFFASGTGKHESKTRGPSNELLHKMECKVCPLNHAKVRSPKMAPTGARKPLIYALGEAPGEEEDRQGRQFVGTSGQLLREYVPDDWIGDIRWNNVIRTRPPGNRNPEPIEMECCRPSIVRDIEQCKPHAIIGFGGVPLRWALDEHTISKWRGRRVPIKVGTHSCWFYPVEHPAFLSRLRKDWYRPGTIGSESERMFMFDLRRAFRDVDAGLPEPDVHDRAYAEADLHLVTGQKSGDLKQVKEFLRWAATQKHNGVDYETQNKRPYHENSRILSIAVGTPDETMAFALAHPEAGWKRDELRELVGAYVAYLQDPGPMKHVHNLAFEMEWTAYEFGRELLRASQWHDTQSMAYKLDERVGGGKPGCLSLEFNVLCEFGINIKDLSNTDVKKLHGEPVLDVLRYNAIDAKYHCLLGKRLLRRLDDEGLRDVYDIHLRRVPTCVLTQIKGVPVDQAKVRQLSKLHGDKIAELEKEIADDEGAKLFKGRTGETFNPLSNKDVLFLLKDIMGYVEEVRKDKTFSVDESVLEKIDEPICKLILDLRGETKLKSTYIDPLDERHPERVVYQDGLLHPILNTTFTESGRLSSEDPNEQNFPKRDEVGKETRKQVAANKAKGEVFAAFDYGQIQARNIAMESKDKVLIKALWERYDIHGDWAKRFAYEYPSRIGGKKFINDKDVMKKFRNDIKNQWVFPSFFGAVPKSKAEYLKIPVEIAEKMDRQFWREFTGVKDWQERLIKFYQKHGYVQSLSGHRRRGPLSPNQIINTPIQADEADIVLDAFSRLSEKGDDDLQANLCIHDDMSFIMDERMLEDKAEIIIETMLLTPFEWAHIVPLSVEVSIGDNWCELKEVETYWSDKWKR